MVLSLSARLVCNALWFQAYWLVAVLGKNQWFMLLVVLWVLHLGLVSQNREEITFSLFVMLLGTAIDSGLTVAGLFVFTTPTTLYIPLWLVGLWLGFACTLKHSLGFLNKSWIYGFVFGGVGGPLSYWAGAKLGAVSFGWSLPIALLTLSILWAILLPGLIWLASQQWTKRYENV